MRMFSQHLATFLIAAVLLTLTLRGADLDTLCTDQKVFLMSDADFVQTYARALGFRWTSNKRDSARAFPQKTKISFQGLPVVEAIVKFEHQQVSEITLSFYNRGDVGPIRRYKFDALVQSGVDKMSKLTETKPKRRRRSGATKKNTYYWSKEKLLYRLESNSGRSRIKGKKVYRAEYVRLRVTQSDPAAKIGYLEKVSGVKTLGALKDRVRRTEEGDVYIDNIPMVDQGPKGYCACATTARVLQYYGRKIDQHEVAQIAKTGDSGGTSSEALLKALKRIQARLRISVKVEEEFDYRSFKRLIKNYNSMARRMKEPKIEFPKTDVISIAGMYNEMNPEVLIATRTKRKSGVRSFERLICRSTDMGVPVIWTVMLGLIKERGRVLQMGGGHMRLIIGYNKKVGEILYSDSWGRGHELKRMAQKEAYAITTGLYILKPR